MKITEVAGGKKDEALPTVGGSAAPPLALPTVWSPEGVHGGWSSFQRCAPPLAGSGKVGACTKTRGPALCDRPSLLGLRELFLLACQARSLLAVFLARPPEGRRTQVSKRARSVLEPRFAIVAETELSPRAAMLRAPTPAATAPGSKPTSTSSVSALTHCDASKYTERLPSDKSQLNHVGTETGLFTCNRALLMTSSAALPAEEELVVEGKSDNWPLVTSHKETWLHTSRTRTCRLLWSTLKSRSLGVPGKIMPS